MHSHTLQQYTPVARAAISIFISYYIEFIYYFSVITHQVALINATQVVHRSHTQFMCTILHTQIKLSVLTSI